MDYYTLTKKEVLNKLKTSTKGLSQKEVLLRREQHGENLIITLEQKNIWHFFFKQFTSYMPWLLFSVGTLALLADRFLGINEHFFDAMIIYAILLINATMNAYQEYHAHKQTRLLEHIHHNECIVIREGKKHHVEARTLVPGDIIILGEGLKIPADARLLQANALEVDESLLTGESLPMTKKTNKLENVESLSQQYNMVFMNTYIKSGTGLAVIVNTATNTEAGKIAGELKKDKESPLTKELDKATNKITLIAVAVVLLVSAVYMSQEQNWSTVILLASALLIGAIPEGLPALVTYAAAHAGKRLLKQHILVKTNTQIETLGSIDILCVDKTGTLTTNKLTVKELHATGTKTTYEKLPKGIQEHFANACILATSAHHTTKGFIGDPIDIALIDYFNEKGFDLLNHYEKHPTIRIEPFNSITKQVRSQHRINKKTITYIKGAPEALLEQSTHIHWNAKTKKITQKEKKIVEENIEQMAKKALRVIALAYDEGKKTVFLGLVGLYDPPKEHLSKLVKELKEASIKIKMITGDNKETAVAVAEQCGINKPKSIDWEELRDLSIDQLKEAVEENDIFSRMSPENKLSIVKALQENNHRVGITGDGVNDVPALEEATVGIAMGKESADMAKEAADLIILDGELNSIIDSIKQGRTIFTNIRRVINYLLTANLGELLLITIGALVGILPILPIQLLWVNFVANYPPAMAFSIDEPPPGIMKRKPTGTKEHFITKKITALSVYISLKKVIILIILFWGSLTLTGNLRHAQTVAFTWLVLWHFVRVMSIRYEDGASLLHNKHMLIALLIPLLAQLIILYTPINELFRVEPLGITTWAVLIIAMLGSIYIEKVISHVIASNVKASDEY